MTVQELRTYALSLPEVGEEPHFDYTSFRVKGRIFCTLPPGSDKAHLFVDEAAARAAVSDDPAAYEELWWGKRLVGVKVHLPYAADDLVCELVEEAWRRRAPKALVTRQTGGAR